LAPGFSFIATSAGELRPTTANNSQQYTDIQHIVEPFVRLLHSGHTFKATLSPWPGS
jgi:hypothetical protein